MLSYILKRLLLMVPTLLGALTITHGVTAGNKFKSAQLGDLALLGAEASPHPAPLSAFTLKVYVAPLVRPVTVHVSADVRHVWPPGADVTWYVVTG